MAENDKTKQYQIDIPVKIDRAAVEKGLGANERTRAAMLKHLDELIPMVEKAVHAKALYRVACVTARGDDWVEIENVRFTSKVLSKNLAATGTVFLTLMTCGRELEELPVSPKDYMRYFCLEAIKTYVITSAGGYLINYIKDRFSLPGLTHLHPGEFADLGIEQQVPLYALFRDPEKAIGVKLTATKTLQPMKSASGIMFYNGTSFESCQLCLQPHCPGRRAPYTPALAKQFGVSREKETHD